MSHRSTSPISADILEAERRRLLQFGSAFPHPQGGAAWLDDDGRPDLTRPVHTWITARMAHVYSLAAITGDDGASELADLAIAGLTGPLRDGRHGGWFSSVSEGAHPDEKSCYAHAFVVLAGASATVAERPGAAALLDEALEIWDRRFWDSAEGMFVDSWNEDFSTLSEYRGVNGNMHAVEALLAAYDATGNTRWQSRALRICRRVAQEFAEPNNWRIPEHFDSQWLPLLEHNRSRPDDPFQPYGATVGHGLEWSRLLLHVEASLGPATESWLTPAAAALFDRAVADGWSVDGAEGFVYTTDWDGTPVMRDRMHWVAAEGVSAAAALAQRTGNPYYTSLMNTWWEYIERYLVDRERGSWHHQLSPENVPTDTVWPGKPDIYHAVQTTLIPRLPLAPGMAKAVRLGLPAGSVGPADA